MPKEFFDDLVLDDRHLQDELNKRLRRIAEELASLRGYDGSDVELGADLAMGGKRVSGLGRAKKGKDAVSLDYLRENAITAQPGDDFVAHRLLIAEAGVRVLERATEPFDLVPLQQLEDEIEDAISTSGGGGGPAPVGAQYVVMALNATLTNERVLAVTSGHLTLSDGGANGNATLGLPSVITAGGPIGDATTVPVITWDAQGRLTAVTTATVSAGGTTHDLLSATHPDTLASAVSRGSLIVGNATPKWAELVIGSAATYLRSDGTDASWATIAYADISGTPSGLPPTGAAGGDLTGTYPNPTLADADLIALRDLAATAGMLSRTGAGAFAARTLTSGSGVTVTNGTGAAGDPTFALDTTVTDALYQPLDADLTEIAALANVRGDLLVTDATPAWTRLGIGAADRFLGSDGTDAAWTAPGALTKTDDTNVTLTLGGTPTTALLRAASLTLGWTGQLAIARGGTNGATALAGFNNLSPLTTRGDLLTRDATNNIRLGIGASGRFLKSDGTDPAWTAITVSDVGGGAALTRVDDTNVTLTLGGSPTTALLAATSLTLGWTGTLAAARLNSNVVQSVVNDTNVTGSISAQALTLGWTGTLGLSRGGTAANLSATGGTGQYLKQSSVGAAVTVGTIPASDIASGAALTRTNDTNVTLTLGGTPTTALLAATSMTLGWSGQLGLSRGGTNADLSATGGTSQVLRQSSAGAAVTVSQLAFSDISGSVTDAQVPNTITLDNITQITTRSHASLQNLSADDHTQYLLLAGRAGGQTANGGTASSDHLNLNANDETYAIANTGRVRFGERMVMDLSASLTASMGSGDAGLLFTGTTTASGSGTVYNYPAVWDARTLSYSVAQAFSFAPTFNCASVFSPTASVTDSSTVYTGYNAFPKVILNTASVTATTPLLAGYTANPFVQLTSGTALTVTNVTGYASGYGSALYFPLAAFDPPINRTAGTLTIGTYRHFHATDPYTNGTYTMTTQVGVDIEAITKGTTNIGLRNASTTVATPTVATVSAAGSAIGHTARIMRLNNTSGGAVTLTSAPTVTDGQDGEILTIFNGSANAVTIQDQGTLANSNLRLSTTTFAIGQRDSITLIYSSTIGDWIEIARTNVL